MFGASGDSLETRKWVFFTSNEFVWNSVWALENLLLRHFNTPLSTRHSYLISFNNPTLHDSYFIRVSFNIPLSTWYSYLIPLNILLSTRYSYWYHSISLMPHDTAAWYHVVSLTLHHIAAWYHSISLSRCSTAIWHHLVYQLLWKDDFKFHFHQVRVAYHLASYRSQWIFVSHSGGRNKEKCEVTR
jgi:hypothetical protein